ncbi:MAG: hypothetical protein EXR62_10880 [Chloroflexi bacterium]|nr:hypothetical protein [Chloroflexota bacterium]
MKKTIFFILLASVLALACACNANSTSHVPLSSATTPSPLPHSMKGYELYSWQAQGQWHFSLMTGTNRVKSLAEITTGADKATAEGWASASVQGVEALKDVLGRLPQNEKIIWVNRQQLEQAGNQAGTIALPPQEILDMIQAHCRQLGLALYVSS